MIRFSRSRPKKLVEYMDRYFTAFVAPDKTQSWYIGRFFWQSRIPFANGARCYCGVALR